MAFLTLAYILLIAVFCDGLQSQPMGDLAALLKMRKTGKQDRTDIQGSITNLQIFLLNSGRQCF